MDEILLYLSIPKDAKNFILVLGFSFIVSFFITYLYVYFYKERATGSQVYKAFPLLGLSITSIFVAIQFSLALSLGLLGALSIVRFRTPIKEPEEIGFIMLIIAASICSATFNLLFLAALLSFAVAALFLQRELPMFDHKRGDGIVVISLPTKEYNRASHDIINCLENVITKGLIDSVTEHAEQSTITYRFTKMCHKDVLSLQTKLKEISSAINSQICFQNQVHYV